MAGSRSFHPLQVMTADNVLTYNFTINHFMHILLKIGTALMYWKVEQMLLQSRPAFLYHKVRKVVLQNRAGITD